MKCESCSDNEASVHVRSVSNDVVREVHCCVLCSLVGGMTTLAEVKDAGLEARLRDDTMSAVSAAEKKMSKAVADERYEDAAELRDNIVSLKVIAGIEDGDERSQPGDRGM